MNKEIKQHGINNLDAIQADDVYGCDLHNSLFNEDYFIIGTAKATEFLEKYGVFKAIEEIKTYEQDNFGAVNTDFSDPEKVANMISYIIGEELLQASDALRDAWDDLLDQDTIDTIKEELESV